MKNKIRMKNKIWKRIGAVLLAGALTAGCGMSAFATDLEQQTASLTIHKYEMENLENIGPEGYGEELTGEALKDIPEGAVPLEGVTFQIYKVDEDKTDTAIPQVEGEDGKMVNAAFTREETTNADGVISWTGLELGRYLVVESDAPAKVYEKTPNFLVDLPMMSKDGKSYNYDVHVYPKNAAVLGAVILTKTGEGEDGPLLGGANYKLQKQNENGDYVDVANAVYTTGTGKDANGNDIPGKGQIWVEDLLIGNYQFVETTPPEGYGLDTTPITFTIDENGSINEDGTTVDTVVQKSVTDKKIPGQPEKTVDKDTATVGSDVVWTITPEVPSDIATYKKFTVSDTLDERLDYKGTKVYLDNEEITSGFSAVYVENTRVLTVDFAEKADREKLAGKKLEIKVTTTIKTKAVEEPGQIPNTAQLTFENAYGTSGTPGSEEVVTFTGNIDIFKYTMEDGKEKALDGAVFALYKTEADASARTNPIEVLGETEAVTDTQGNTSFNGLAAGTYWVNETQAPQYKDGDTTKRYNLLSEPVKVVLDKADEDGVVAIKVQNKKSGISLPLTGSTGTIVFIFAGLMMVSGAAVVLAYRKRQAA